MLGLTYLPQVVANSLRSLWQGQAGQHWRGVVQSLLSRDLQGVCIPNESGTAADTKARIDNGD